MDITKENVMQFDKWLMDNPDITQDDREIIIEFVNDYLRSK